MHPWAGGALYLSILLTSIGTPMELPAAKSREQTTPPDGGLTEPKIIPSQTPFTPPEKCKKKRHNTVDLHVDIDEHGTLRGYYFQNVLGKDADNSILDHALDIARADQFSPALRAGVPVAVERTLQVDIETCVERVKQPDGTTVERVVLQSPPAQSIGTLPDGSNSPMATSPDAIKTYAASPSHIRGSISAPVALTHPEAQYTDEARRLHVQGRCLVSVIVDPYGFPQNPRVVRPIGYGLDGAAVEAIRKYRFRPAIKSHVGPVPVMVTIEVNFRL
ncbi:MAG TPA: TonB family protein [Terracidiphilus sp.]|jgi:TonB family protein|nr:TonB family protein [Terracidiphilus sp.]